MSRLKADDERVDKAAILANADEDYRTPGAMLACNEETVRPIQEALATARKIKFDDRVKAVKELFEKYGAANQRDAARMPTKVRGQFVARLQNELAVDLVAQQFCAVDTIAWGESYEYSTATRTALPIYKMSEPGGHPKSIGYSNDEGLVYLGTPILYTTEEFAVQRFNRHAPDKWLREIDRAVTRAKEDLADQIDQDIWTTLETQIVSSALDTTAFSYKNSRVKDIPTANLKDDSSENGITKQVVQDIIMQGVCTKRRLQRVLVPSLAMETIWDWVDSNTYAPRISQALMEEIERTGGVVLNLWGYNIVFQPTNVLEGSSGSRYAYASLDPLDGLSVPGAAFYVTSQLNDENDAYDFLEFQRREGPYDFFVAHEAVLIAAIDYQKANLLKVQYDS